MMSDYFSGDWEYDETLEGHVMAYEAVLFDAPWNGFAVPTVTRRVANAMVLRWQLLALAWDGNFAMDSWQWDGEALSIIDAEGEEMRIEPDIAGNYTLDIGYTFTRLEEEANVIAFISSKIKEG